MTELAGAQRRACDLIHEAGEVLMAAGASQADVVRLFLRLGAEQVAQALPHYGPEAQAAHTRAMLEEAIAASAATVAS